MPPLWGFRDWVSSFYTNGAPLGLLRNGHIDLYIELTLLKLKIQF